MNKGVLRWWLRGAEHICESDPELAVNIVLKMSRRAAANV
jgi:hypothetical protein